MTQRILLMLSVAELTVCKSIGDARLCYGHFCYPGLTEKREASEFAGTGPEIFRSTGSLSVVAPRDISTAARSCDKVRGTRSGEPSPTVPSGGLLQSVNWFCPPRATRASILLAVEPSASLSRVTHLKGHG